MSRSSFTDTESDCGARGADKDLFKRYLCNDSVPTQMCSVLLLKHKLLTLSVMAVST